jgi:hypothetical protein
LSPSSVSGEPNSVIFCGVISNEPIFSPTLFPYYDITISATICFGNFNLNFNDYFLCLSLPFGSKEILVLIKIKGDSVIGFAIKEKIQSS